ncbi:MAG: AlpA family phage regulatory protein [Gammaproteobacteria bacterium]|nr:AlpA family phage regulatory protein [Gammaproteobacteria bacterium]
MPAPTLHIRFSRRPEVLKRAGFSNTTLHQRIKAGIWPPAVPLGPSGTRAVGWVDHEIDQVLSAMVAGKSEAHIRALVSHLVEQRKNAAQWG